MMKKCGFTAYLEEFFPPFSKVGEGEEWKYVFTINKSCQIGSNKEILDFVLRF